MKTPQHDEWYTGMEKEVRAMFKKGVLVPIDETEAPQNATKPRIVCLGNNQDPGIDFVTAFSPCSTDGNVSSADSTTKYGLTLYQGDVDTAYLNATLKIQQYVQAIPGFPQPKKKIYSVGIEHYMVYIVWSGMERRN
ncbi:unnamed protein product [Peronospora belbahrii]|uniref:Reverse transcriptase Ty1/copia-type domain-containing protein n=1 Tax=Peronospora belbahrii TaxID=622444 RepID=A0AAU9LC85_9STRA|nr:unnamed protein product [Peronospora belbahrii]CAH0522152.1 unnamed protein product [Peronospora belbahrii]